MASTKFCSEINSLFQTNVTATGFYSSKFISLDEGSEKTTILLSSGKIFSSSAL